MISGHPSNGKGLHIIRYRDLLSVRPNTCKVAILPCVGLGERRECDPEELFHTVGDSLLPCCFCTAAIAAKMSENIVPGLPPQKQLNDFRISICCCQTEW